MSDAYDSPWKEILHLYFEPFMAFFCPGAHAEIDWSRGYVCLDKELQKVVRDAASGRRYVDKLIKVWLKSGLEQYVFIHIEIQGEVEGSFGERVFCYNYRIYDQHRRPVMSLAVLGDDSPGWRPDGFHYELWGCRVGIQFPVIKLWDYNERWAELEASDSIFATVVMAHLKTRETRRDAEERFRWKMHLVRRLYEKNYRRKEVLELFRFIDWLLALPAELEKKFTDDLVHYEDEVKMRYVTNIERQGIERGLQQGMEQGMERGLQQGMERGLQQGMERGLQQGMERGLQRGQLLGEAAVLRRLLHRRFDRLPAWAEHRLEEASITELETWTDRVFDAQRLDDIFAAPKASDDDD